MCRTAMCVAVVMVLAILAGRAQAHKLHVFAAVDGKMIRGEIYFRGGGAAARVQVKALGPGGQVLGQTTTDDRGKFALPVRFRCEHRVVADAGEGHTAEYRIAEQELPVDLPAQSAAGAQADSATSSAPGGLRAEGWPLVEATGKQSGAGEGQLAVRSAGQGADLGASIEALRIQVLDLRGDFDAFRQEIRVRDVLGGIGYILGVAGVVLYVVCRRRTGQG